MLLRGVRLIQDSVSHQYAKVRAVVDLANGNNAGQEVELGVRLLDGQKVVAQQKQTLTLAGNAALQQELTFEINNPHLWNGRQDPVPLSGGGILVERRAVGRLCDAAFRTSLLSD